ncbi:hypothetical protein MR781_08500 [bacterium]|nr:hypothetical protein [bacterium]MDY4503930.1 hypothetical protein [Bariatricus sp.]
MRIKYSDIHRVILWAASFLMMGYVYVFSEILITGNPRKVIVGIVSLFFLCIGFVGGKHNRAWKKSAQLKNYLLIFSICVVLEMIVSMTKYDYSVWSILVSAAPYCYIFLTIPIYNLFTVDGGTDKFLKSIVVMEIIILTMKAICWYTNSYTSLALFPNILREYSGWSVGGNIRIEPGCMFGLTFVYCLVNYVTNRKKTYGVLTLGLFLFMILITKFRFQLLAMLGVAFVILYMNRTNDARYAFLKRSFLVLLLVSVAVIYLPDIMASFSVDSARGNSTKTRLVEIAYFWQLIKTKSAVIGLGIMEEGNAAVSSMLQYIGQRMYIEDLGIIGAFFSFGLLMVPIYGNLFAMSIKNITRCQTCSDYEKQMLTGIVTYMVLSCLALNIFDPQRAFAVPFYLAIITYIRTRNTSDRMQEEPVR